MKGGVLQRLESRGGWEEATQYDRPGQADALVAQIELGDGVLAQRDERNAAEIGQRGVLKDDLGQILGAIASDAIGTDTIQNGSRKGPSAGIDSREKEVRRRTRASGGSY